MLHARGELPVVAALEPALRHGGVVDRAWYRQPEAGVRHGAALAVRHRAHQVAIRSVVAIGVAPRPRRLRDEAAERVGILRDRRARGERFEIAVQADFDRRLPVAEQVIRGAEMRRDVMP